MNSFTCLVVNNKFHPMTKRKRRSVCSSVAFNSLNILRFSLTNFFLLVLFILQAPTLGTAGPTGDRTPIINTRYGQIQGTYRTLESGDKVATYLGIPYATPPINKNRLSPTRASAQWQRVLHAVNFGPSCPQNPPSKFAHLLRHQSEDCLYLNLFVPVGLKNAPVLIVIPGESYDWGSASLYDCTLLAARGRYLVVTLNYRLGILGFLNPIGDGQKRTTVVNYGLMDQIAALHWVQENIGVFGGDPNQVTVMGRGHAAACIAFLIISPATAPTKLFHRAILMSGTAMSPWSLVQNPSHFAGEVSLQLNCGLPKLNMKHELLHQCIRNRTVEQILRVQLENPQFLSSMGPAIDGVTIANNWRQQLNKISKTGKSPVDLLIGVAEDDVYSIFNREPYVNGFPLDTRDRIFRTFVTNTFHYHLQELLLTITAHYTDWSHPAQHPLTTKQLTMEALQDATLVAPAVTTAIKLAAPHKSTYFYVMEASHADQPPLLEMAYVLGAPLGTSYPLSGRDPNNFTKDDMVLSEAIINFWSNFIKTGNPNDPSIAEISADHSQYRAPIWEIFDPINRRYLELGLNRARLRDHYRSGRVALWTWLLPALEGVGARHGPESPYHRLPDFHRKDTFSGPTRPRPLLPAISTSDSTATESAPRVNDAELNGFGPNGTLVYNRSHPYEGGEWLQAATGKKEGLYPHDNRNNQDINSVSYSTTLSLTAALGISLLLLNALVLATVHCRRNSRSTKHSAESSESGGGNNTLSMPSPSHCGTLRSSTTLRSIAGTPFTASECPPEYSACPKQVAHMQGTPIHLQQISEQTTLYHAGHMSPQPPMSGHMSPQPQGLIQPPPQELQYHATQAAPDIHYGAGDQETMQALSTFVPPSVSQYQQSSDEPKPSNLRLTSSHNQQGPQQQQPSPIISSNTTVHC